jgi:hypothetical protein
MFGKDGPLIGLRKWKGGGMRRCVADWRATGGEEEEAGSGRGAHICSWRGPCNDTVEVAVFTDLECKLWESNLRLAIFWACKRERDIRFRGIRRELRGARGVKNGTLCRRNERCAVEYRPLPTLTPPPGFPR